MDIDYEKAGVRIAARKYLKGSRSDFNNWIREFNSARAGSREGKESYDANELWDYFEDVESLEDGLEKDIILSPDLSLEAGAEYLDIDIGTAYMTVLEEDEDIENYSRHRDEDVTTMIDFFLYEWKDPREIAQSVDTGETGVSNVLNRMGIEASEDSGEITKKRVRMAENKNLSEEDMRDFVLLGSEKPFPDRQKPGYLQKRKNSDETRYELDVEMDDIGRKEAAVWYMQNAEDEDPAQLTTSLLQMEYEVDRRDEHEIMEEAPETEISTEKAELLKQEYEDKVL